MKICLHQLHTSRDGAVGTATGSGLPHRVLGVLSSSQSAESAAHLVPYPECTRGSFYGDKVARARNSPSASAEVKKIGPILVHLLPHTP
jgi:hypothetical protein